MVLKLSYIVMSCDCNLGERKRMLLCLKQATPPEVKMNYSC